MKVGVLALQGSSALHLERLEAMGTDPIEVRQRPHLDGLTHLVMPGGESTTIDHLLRLFDLRDDIIARHQRGELVLFGTCAGAILLGQDDGERPTRMGLLDAVLTRNAYGRQVESFTEELVLEGMNERRFHCVFIRAPRFRSVGKGARVLATRDREPILVEGPGVLAATFHPELTDDDTVHRYFLNMPPRRNDPVSSPRLQSKGVEL